MVISQKFNSADDISKTRASLNLRLGEIISAVIGDGRSKALFDEAGKHPDQYAGQATGEMALKLGVITPVTKTALLVAQAAERSCRLAEKAESYALNRDNLVSYYRKKNRGVAKESLLSIDKKSSGVLELYDPVFKFVGQEGDPEILKAAQNTWMTAQGYLNEVVSNINQEVAAAENTEKMTWLLTGPKPADGFRVAAIGFYTLAAQLLSEEGHMGAAEKLMAAKEEISSCIKNHAGPFPAAFTTYIVRQETEDLIEAVKAQQKPPKL